MRHYISNSAVSSWRLLMSTRALNWHINAAVCLELFFFLLLYKNNLNIYPLHSRRRMPLCLATKHIIVYNSYYWLHLLVTNPEQWGSTGETSRGKYKSWVETFEKPLWFVKKKRWTLEWNERWTEKYWIHCFRESIHVQILRKLQELVLEKGETHLRQPCAHWSWLAGSRQKGPASTEWAPRCRTYCKLKEGRGESGIS